MTPWKPTIAHVRAAAGGVLLVIAAVLVRRPDLIVIGSPLLTVAIWSTLRRPREVPIVTERIDHGIIREGDATTWRIHVVHEDRSEDVSAVLARADHSDLEPQLGGVTAASSTAVAKTPSAGRVTDLSVVVRSTRWGRRPIGPATVVASSAWAAFRWSSDSALSGEAAASASKVLTTLPMPSVFDAAAPVAHRSGLVGLSRSSRPGDGSEFASIRPFQPGDRLRRIHWPRSTRSGTMHVTSTWADQDAHVVLLVDAFNDIGTSEGLDGNPSSCDIAVRAAAAIAEHHLHRGDRVALQIIGSRGAVRVPPASGMAHHRRILDTLATIEPATVVGEDIRLRLGLGADALVVMLSPLISPLALARANALANRGITVVVVDTLPPTVSEIDPEDPLLALAWRLRLLERRREIRRIETIGVPVVAWRGPGSLDQVLRDVHRRVGAPRLVRR